METKELTLLETENLRDFLDEFDDVDALKREYLSGLERGKTAWKKKITEIMEQNGYTNEQMAQECGVTKAAVAKWRKGAIPSGRDTFIRIGLAAHYSVEEMNKFLVRYGKCSTLYAKSLEDSVYIFVLSSKRLQHTYQECKRIEEQIEEELKGQWARQPGEIKETGMMENLLKRLSTEDELRRFMRESLPEYRNAYSKFYDQVIASIAVNHRRFTEVDETGKNIVINIDGIARALSWSASLRRCVYEIQKRIWFPRRRKVISLGIHLNMTVDEINELLELARMETLCPKDPVESAIIFAVTDADLNGKIPSKSSQQSFRDKKENLDEYVQEGTVLCEYVRKVLEYLELPDAEALIQDLLVDW